MTIPERPLHILAVDDEEQIRRALRSILHTRNYVVNLAETGREALIKAIDEPPDLVILDLGLPDMSGIEVCHELRSWTTVPILVLSVRSAETDKIEALDEGADDYLTKPFSAGELLGRCCGGRRRWNRRRRWSPPATSPWTLPAGSSPSAARPSVSRPRSSTSWRCWPATPTR